MSVWLVCIASAPVNSRARACASCIAPANSRRKVEPVKAREVRGLNMIEHPSAVDEESTRLTYARVCCDADGGTHFRESAVGMTPIEYVPGIPLVDSASPLPVRSLTFSRVEAGYT